MNPPQERDRHINYFSSMFANSGGNENFFATSLLHSRNSWKFLVKKDKGKQEQCQQTQKSPSNSAAFSNILKQLVQPQFYHIYVLGYCWPLISSIYQFSAFPEYVHKYKAASSFLWLNFQRISTFMPMSLMRTCKITVLWCSHQCKGQLIFLARPDAVMRSLQILNTFLYI